MIVTTIDKLDFYSEIPYSKDIMTFIENFKKTDMKPGRYDIHGDDLFAAAMTPSRGCREILRATENT